MSSKAALLSTASAKAGQSYRKCGDAGQRNDNERISARKNDPSKSSPGYSWAMLTKQRLDIVVKPRDRVLESGLVECARCLCHR